MTTGILLYVYIVWKLARHSFLQNRYPKVHVKPCEEDCICQLRNNKKERSMRQCLYEKAFRFHKGMPIKKIFLHSQGSYEIEATIPFSFDPHCQV